MAALPWLGLASHDTPDPDAVPSPNRAIGFGDVARTRLGWAMAAFFGLQSLRRTPCSAGSRRCGGTPAYSAAQAGALVGVVAATSIPLSAWSPRAIARPGNQRRVLIGVMLLYPVAYVGLMVAPYSLAVLWAVVLGAATTTFPMVLTLIGLRASTPEGTAALSSFTQSTGYLLAAIGPFGVGVLHDASGGWTVPLLALTALVVPMLALGVVRRAARRGRGPAGCGLAGTLGSRRDRRADPRRPAAGPHPAGRPAACAAAADAPPPPPVNPYDQQPTPPDPAAPPAYGAAAAAGVRRAYGQPQYGQPAYGAAAAGVRPARDGSRLPGVPGRAAQGDPGRWRSSRWSWRS